MGFESGTLAEWTVTGDAKVIKHLGETTAPEGNYMLQIATGDFKQQLESGWTAFQTCVPTGFSWLRLSWRFYSEEFHEWCGSEYQDYFRVTVRDKAGHEAVFSRDIDSLCNSSDCFGCGTENVGLTPSDVQFDKGDTHVTPWQIAYLPTAAVSGSSEKTLEVVFEVGDKGDSIGKTLVLVDDVAFVATQDQETCLEYGCPPHYPLCVEVGGYWNCVECDSDDDCLGDCSCKLQDFTCVDADGQVCETCKDYGCADPYPACANVGGTWQCVQCTSDNDCDGTCTCSDNFICIYPATGQSCVGDCPSKCTTPVDCPPSPNGETLDCHASGVCFNPAGGCDGVTSCCGPGQQCFDLLSLLFGGMGGIMPGMPIAMGYCSCGVVADCLGGEPCTDMALLCDLPIISDMICAGGSLPADVPAKMCFDSSALLGGTLP